MSLKIAQIQKTVKAQKTKAFGSYLSVPDILTTTFQIFKWGGISERILIENDSKSKWIEYSFDSKQIFRLEAGEMEERRDMDASKIYVRGQVGGEDFKIGVSYR